jgi:transposase InsO family protein
LAGVSRSGYYAFLKSESIRQQLKERDLADYRLINQVFNQRRCKVGALQIKMILENDYGVVMNHKRIRRIMRKFHLFTKVRQPNPYKKMAKATQEHKTCPNLLERNFDTGEPQKVLLTDITYLYYKRGQKAYLSVVKDGATREILAYYLSPSLRMELVYETLKHLKSRTDIIIHPDSYLHSDQGFHYTHPEFQKKVKDMGLKQSMSRKGNCWDNAPIESFFGHMKDELELSTCESFEDLKIMIDEYMVEYNCHRYQWALEKMTPAQYRSHLICA